MHKIPVGGDEIGVMFVIGVLVPILIALPEAPAPKGRPSLAQANGP